MNRSSAARSEAPCARTNAATRASVRLRASGMSLHDAPRPSRYASSSGKSLGVLMVVGLAKVRGRQAIEWGRCCGWLSLEHSSKTRAKPLNVRADPCSSVASQILPEVGGPSRGRWSRRGPPVASPSSVLVTPRKNAGTQLFESEPVVSPYQLRRDLVPRGAERITPRFAQVGPRSG